MAAAYASIVQEDLFSYFFAYRSRAKDVDASEETFVAPLPVASVVYQGLGSGVGLGFGVGRGLGAGVGLGVAVAVGVGLGVAECVGVDVGVGVTLGVGVGPPVTSRNAALIGPQVWKP